MLFSNKFVKLIENNADDLTKKWMRLVKSHPGTTKYRSYDEKHLYAMAFNVYSRLGQWLSRETTKKEIAKHFTALGAKRREEGFRISEVIQALTITRRVLWFKVLEDGFIDSALDLRAALDLDNSVVQFFDRCIFFAAVGYEQGEIPSPESLTLPPDAVLK